MRLDPSIPEELGSLAFDIRYRGHVVHLEFTTDSAKVRVDLAEGEPITVDIAGVVKVVDPGETLEVKLPPPSPRLATSTDDPGSEH